MRHHIIRITSARWEDKEFREAIRAQARGHAGRNPGMIVTVKRQVMQTTRYEAVWTFVNRSGEKREW